MAKSELSSVNSLVGFVNDTKPYHSKLTETVVEYQYDDPMTVTMEDSSSMNIVLSSIWGKNNNNPNNTTRLYTSWSAADVTDGTPKYLQFRIPATVFPRFSKDSYIKYEFARTN